MQILKYSTLVVTIVQRFEQVTHVITSGLSVCRRPPNCQLGSAAAATASAAAVPVADAVEWRDQLRRGVKVHLPATHENSHVVD